MNLAYPYFKPADDVLPFPMGHLLSSVRGVVKFFLINMKIKTAKISSGGETGFLRKFGPVKISRYTVVYNSKSEGGADLGTKLILTSVW